MPVNDNFSGKSLKILKKRLLKGHNVAKFKKKPASEKLSLEFSYKVTTYALSFLLAF